MPTVNEKKKKVLSPIEKLIKRINREFPKKRYIGDIHINDEEYTLLVKYAKISFNNILNKYNHIIIDPIFATALVQIGIRHYDGNYWSNFARELDIAQLKTHQQTWIGESFIYTLKFYKKLTLEMQKVDTILMHGFVSDKFSERFFDFLYKFYSIDLERDIERLDAQLINSLVEVMIRNDNRDRTSMLVSHTSDALRINPRGSKIRIRRWLKLIDKCFWDDELPSNLNNRFNRHFINWTENSTEFNNDYKKFYNGEATKYRNKSFSYPYLMCNLEKTIFYLVLPKQLINNEDPGDVQWVIRIGEEKTVLGTELYEAITGYITEKLQIEIESEHLFDEIIIELRNANCRIRKFKISHDCIRFFNSKGINIKSDAIGVGSMYSFSKKEAVTEALIENQILPSGIVFSYYEFQKGDIIKLPDGKPVSIGKRIEEGLMQRGFVDKVFLIVGDENIIVYNNSPSVLIKMNESKVNGTLININGKIYRFTNIEANIINLNDRSDELGYLIKLSELIKEDGIYEIYIDVPNDRTNRYWKFALIKNFSFKFDGSPYIFKTKGTISFAEGIKVIPKNKEVTIIPGENSYKFPIIPGNFDLRFDININNNHYTLCFEVPVFAYRFDYGDWQIEKPLDIWHSKFPQNISIKYPNDTITLKMENNDLESEIEQSASYRYIKEKGYIDCDVIRFNSWFGRNETIRKIYLDLDENNKNIEFINVITKSVLLSNLITYDPLKELLMGQFEITGYSDYYIDIEFEGKKIVEKQKIIDGKIEIKSALNSGTYTIYLYEDEEDDTGFGEKAYQLVDKVLTELINPYDLQGKSLALKTIKKGHKSIFSLSLSKKYVIQDLKRICNDDYNNYYGKLVIDGKYTENYVYVKFNDIRALNYCYIYFKDEYDDETEFLYDDYNKTIEYVEIEGLKASERYRRYDSIFEEDYFYVVEFLSENKNAGNIRRAKIIKELKNKSAITLN